MTLDDLDQLSKQIDTEFVFATSEADLLRQLNEGYQGWMMLRCPWWHQNFLVALVARPAADDDEDDD